MGLFGKKKSAEELAAEAKAARKAGDLVTALALSEKAAGMGNITAQYNCGIMYFNGEGTARDKTRAWALFQKVAAQTKNEVLQGVAKKILQNHF